MRFESSKPKFQSLESLRIVAALAVVMAHSGAFYVPWLKWIIGFNYFLGSCGVDIFFVISGFVMAQSAKNAEPGLGGAIEFLIGRALRIFPLYFLVTIGWAIKGYFNGERIDAIYLAESLLLLPTPGPEFVRDPLVGFGWTLRFEFFFYLLVAIGVATRRQVLVPVAGIFLSVCAWGGVGFYYGSPIVLEFVAGFLLGIYQKAAIERMRVRLGCPAFLFALFGAVVILLLASLGRDFGNSDHGIYSQVPRLWVVYPWGELPRVVAWGLPAVFLVYCCLALEGDRKWYLSSLGKYTYSVYLLQIFSIFVCEKAKLYLSWSSEFAFVANLVFLAFMSYMSYRYVESRALLLRPLLLGQSKSRLY